MGTYRMFCDDAGKARWEPIDLAQAPEWTEGFGATNIRFAVRPPGQKSDWHPAPRRQFVIIVSGELDIGFEDGTTKTFGAGDIRLMEDLTGKGHTTTNPGTVPCVTAVVELEP